MKWYKIVKIIIELLTFGLFTYEKFNKEEDRDVSNDSTSDSTPNN